MWRTLFYISLVPIFLACNNAATNKEFDEMKMDLDEASEMYCKCMIDADSLKENNPMECKEILNKMLLEKCGSNEKAQKYVHEAIRKCVESRGEIKENED
ncbi:MAG: hypothetical protein KDC84_05195 [Crocinitomicaceae bacterium]|nr:hypothetical protein [Crocinitomicaceae bacterium]